jgi:hypothetical protein
MNGGGHGPVWIPILLEMAKVAGVMKGVTAPL